MMRRNFLTILVVLLASVLLPGIVQAQEGKLKVGLVFDVGGRGDKSFNDAAYRGLEQAQKEFGVEIKYIEPTQAADKDTALRSLAEAGYDLVFGIGFLFSEAIRSTAEEFPDAKFACIDYDVKEGESIPPNLAGLKFREEEGSFIVGAIAGLLSKTGKVGFVGGMDIPLIHKFQAGYTAGAKAVRPDAQVVVNYAGVTPEAFKDPSKGKELALTQFSAGADIIYHASGSTGLGVFQAAKEKKMSAIGVDSDQYHEMPGHVVTSMLKRVDVAVYETIKASVQGKFEGGIRVFGLAEDGVSYVYDDNNKGLIPAEVIAKIEELKKKIVAGEIKVPNQ